eukprot:5402519-Pleurochrysis_carterae.AAC.3
MRKAQLPVTQGTNCAVQIAREREKPLSVSPTDISNAADSLCAESASASRARAGMGRRRGSRSVDAAETATRTRPHHRSNGIII